MLRLVHIDTELASKRTPESLTEHFCSFVLGWLAGGLHGSNRPAPTEIERFTSKLFETQSYHLGRA